MVVLFFQLPEASARADGPPWVVQMEEETLINVEWPQDLIAKWLPADLVPAQGRRGGLVLHSAKSGTGFPAFTASYAFVEIDGFDSADGDRARWIFDGVVSPAQRFAANLGVLYGWPIREGAIVRRLKGESVQWSLNVGTVDLVKQGGGHCAPNNHIVNYLARSDAAGTYTLAPVVSIGTSCPMQVNSSTTLGLRTLTAFGTTGSVVVFVAPTQVFAKHSPR